MMLKSVTMEFSDSETKQNRKNILNKLWLLPIRRCYKTNRSRGRGRMVVGFTATYVIRPIASDVVSSNRAQTKCTYTT